MHHCYHDGLCNRTGIYRSWLRIIMSIQRFLNDTLLLWCKNVIWICFSMITNRGQQRSPNRNRKWAKRFSARLLYCSGRCTFRKSSRTSSSFRAIGRVNNTMECSFLRLCWERWAGNGCLKPGRHRREAFESSTIFHFLAHYKHFLV